MLRNWSSTLQILDLKKSHEEEMRSAQFQHQSDRRGLMKDMLAKEAIMMDKFAQDKLELQSKVDDINLLLKEANVRWESRSSLLKDVEQIESL